MGVAMGPVRRIFVKRLSGTGFGLPSRVVLLFGLGSLALLATTLGAFWHEYRAEWRLWQRRLEATAHVGPDGGSDELGLRQIWLRDIDRVDRCTSCHLRPEDGSTNETSGPLRAHPAGWLAAHRVDRFGCTVCHGGVGEATSRSAAGHAGQRAGLEPMASRELMEARCGTCHLERRPRGAEILARGRARIAEFNCIACHEIPGFDAREVKAPRLDGLARKVSPSWLRRWLTHPRDVLPRTRMGDFRLTHDEVEGLAAFLLEPHGPALPSVPGASGGDPTRGGEIFRRSRCVTCHAVDGRGGTMGPDLASVGAKASAAWLAAWITDPHALQSATRMPRFGFSEAEVRDLVAYIVTELGAEPPGEASNDRPDAALSEKGRAIFERRGCGSCHGLTDGPTAARIGPKLSSIGDRVLEQAPLVERGLKPTLPNWLFLKVQAPDAVLEGARMPTFGFNERQAAELAVALSSLRLREMPAARTTRDQALSFDEPQGEFGTLVRRYRCLSCHSLAGAGGTLSTVSFDRIGSQLSRDYIEAFILEPAAVRVSIAERMPRLGVTAVEARVLADHMARVLVDDRLTGDIASDPATIERGKRLFDRLGCVGCHIAGESGGYVGPDLNGSGKRLKPGWTVEWLRAPGRWKPETLQPDYGLSREEAEALAAYTLSLPPRKGKGPQ